MPVILHSISTMTAQRFQILPFSWWCIRQPGWPRAAWPLTRGAKTWHLNNGAAGQMPPEAVVCRWSWDIRGMARGRSDPRWAWLTGGCMARRDEASGVPQGGVCARVGDVLAVIKAARERAAGPVPAADSVLEGPPAAHRAHTGSAAGSAWLSGLSGVFGSRLPRSRLSSSRPPRLGRPGGPSRTIGCADPRHGSRSPGIRRLSGRRGRTGQAWLSHSRCLRYRPLVGCAGTGC